MHSVNFKTKKIEKIIPLQVKSKITIISGKHVGKNGEIEKIDEKDQKVLVKMKDRNAEVLIKQIIAIE